MTTSPKQLAPNLWLMPFPLKMLGVDLQRNVTIIRLDSGKLIIHSTAPFRPEDVFDITALGEPAWLVDTLLRHDTFAHQGRHAFPTIPYLAPEGFAKGISFDIEPLLPLPADWSGEIALQPILGAPEFGEIVMLHRASRTLIVADLVFNFPGKHGLWTNFLLGAATVGGHHAPGVTRPFKSAITDPAAYEASIRAMLEWDFDRVIVGHGSPIETGGKEKLRTALREAGVAKV